MANCTLCPRQCSIDRAQTRGFCSVGETIKVARAALHFWEEPCLSGTKGSGTIFFSGCNLKCVYCQNSEISQGVFGKEISPAQLRGLYGKLIDQGAHNINLVTPTHYADVIARTLDEPLPVPVVWNSSGYESVQTLRTLAGKVQIYLPDLKYLDGGLAGKYSHAPDYPAVAKAAIDEMFAQVGPFQFNENGILQKGVVIRHLALPGQLDNTFDVIDYVAEKYNNQVLFSLMCQYVPCYRAGEFAEISRPLTQEEYDRLESYLRFSPIEAGYMQDLEAASEEYIPPFDLTGL